MTNKAHKFTKGHTKSQGKRQRIVMKITRQMIADERGVTKAAVRKAVERGKLDLSDIRSVYKYMVKG